MKCEFMDKRPFAVECYNTVQCDVRGYVVEGTDFIESVSGKLSLEAGNSYLLRAGDHYKFCAETNESRTHVSVGFSGEIVTNVLDAYGFTQTTLFAGINIYSYLKQIESITLDTHLSDDLTMDRCCTIFVEMCQYIRQQLRFKKEETQDFRDGDFRDVELLKEYMDTHLNECFTLERCSEIVSLSTSQTARKFRSVYGMSPCKYLNYQRIETAKRMLCDTAYSIQEIAELIGFRDPYYFSRYFKKMCGKSPRQYRESTEI